MSSVALSRFAYDRIREMFLNHRFSAGMKISETKLAKELGISRTPVREAIRQLQMEGLLYQVAQSGTYISSPGRREISEIYEVRLALEVQAIGKAATRLRREELDELSRLLTEMEAYVSQFQKDKAKSLIGEPLRRFLLADMNFHLTIFQAADNQTAIKIYSDVQMRNRAFGDRSHRRDQRHLDSVLNSHTKILQALQREDETAAKESMAEHIENSLRDALDTFDHTPPVAPAGDRTIKKKREAALPPPAHSARRRS